MSDDPVIVELWWEDKWWLNLADNTNDTTC